MLSFDHQNYSKWHKWCHIRYKKFGAFDFAKAGSGKGPKIEDLDFTDEEMDMYVDLHPITNTSPYTVVETMSLAKAAVLFRALGLRHLLVVPKTPGVSSLSLSFTLDCQKLEGRDICVHAVAQPVTFFRQTCAGN